ncbi:MAG: 1-phosphofructokinase [Lachnospiraceae bacterium]
MIYTITFNPALDYIVTVEDFKMGLTNRTDAEALLAGGKGINVSIVLRNLGLENTALGFIAGFTGEEIKRRLEAIGCQTEFITIRSGFSRINVKLKNVDGTEINGKGPDIDSDSLGQLLTRLDALKKGDVLVLAGSIPASIPDSIYYDIMKRLSGKGITIVVDATRDLLMNVLPLQPFLIKPNNHELGEIFGVTLKTAEDVIPYAKKLQELGARNVLVSMAGEGAVLVAENGEVYKRPAPKGKLVNAVGAGDSMVAGFITGWLHTKDYGEAFKMGVATGSASAFSERLATREEVEKLLKQMEG